MYVPDLSSSMPCTVIVIVVGQGRGGDGHALFTRKMLLLELIMRKSSEVNSLNGTSTCVQRKGTRSSSFAKFQACARTHEALLGGPN